MSSVLTRPRRALFAVLATVGLLAAACGDDDEAAEDTTETTEAEDTTETTEAEDTTETTEGDAGGETVEVTAVDYAFEGLPSEVAAGTQLTLVNESTAELHELIAFLIPESEERPVAELMALSEEESATVFAGEPAAVLLAPPGATEDIEAVGDGTLTEPGRYAIACFIPTGVDPDAYLNAPPSDGPPDVPGGPPHVTQGMFAELVVE